MADIIMWFGMVAAYLTVLSVPAALVWLWLEGLKHPVYAKARHK